MNSEEQLEYCKVLSRKTLELIYEKPKTTIEKHINNLKYMLYQIQPQSKYWKWGMVKALRFAIKLAEKENKKVKIEEVEE